MVAPRPSGKLRLDAQKGRRLAAPPLLDQQTLLEA
jgi:hypothetical protein